MDDSELPTGIVHPIAELDGKVQAMRDIQPSNIVREVAPIYVFQENTGLPLNLLHEVGKDDIGMPLQVDPGLRLIHKPVYGILIPEVFILKGLDGEYLVPLAIEGDVNNPHATPFDIMNFIAVQNPVPYLPPSRRHLLPSGRGLPLRLR